MNFVVDKAEFTATFNYVRQFCREGLYHDGTVVFQGVWVTVGKAVYLTAADGYTLAHAKLSAREIAPLPFPQFAHTGVGGGVILEVLSVVDALNVLPDNPLRFTLDAMGGSVASGEMEAILRYMVCDRQIPAVKGVMSDRAKSPVTAQVDDPKAWRKVFDQATKGKKDYVRGKFTIVPDGITMEYDDQTYALPATIAFPAKRQKASVAIDVERLKVIFNQLPTQPITLQFAPLPQAMRAVGFKVGSVDGVVMPMEWF